MDCFLRTCRSGPQTGPEGRAGRAVPRCRAARHKGSLPWLRRPILPAQPRQAALRLSTTRILMKKLSENEIREYVSGHEWQGCCGYKIEGCMEAYVSKIIGSYSGVVGLPLYETKNLLNGAGIK